MMHWTCIWGTQVGRWDAKHNISCAKHVAVFVLVGKQGGDVNTCTAHSILWCSYAGTGPLFCLGSKAEVPNFE
jgi:hypothetical protein